MSNRILIVLGLLLANAHFAQARLMYAWTSDELAEKAGIVCNGLVTDISVSSESRPVKYESVIPDTHQMKTVTAKIKVLSKFKGDVPEEIEIRYPKEDTNISINRPSQIDLQSGKRYRFHLKSVPGQPYYVSFLDGKFDDAPSVELLADNERDDNPPLFRKEAIELAKQSLAGKLPDFSEEVALYNSFWRSPPQWQIMFYGKERSTYPQTASDAKIYVNVSDRKVDARSWYSKESPGKRTIPDEDDIGKEVIIFLLRKSEHGERSQTYIGVIEKITADEISGEFADANTFPATRRPMTIVSKYIQSIQRIYRIAEEEKRSENAQEKSNEKDASR